MPSIQRYLSRTIRGLLLISHVGFLLACIGFCLFMAFEIANGLVIHPRAFLETPITSIALLIFALILLGGSILLLRAVLATLQLGWERLREPREESVSSVKPSKIDAIALVVFGCFIMYIVADSFVLKHYVIVSRRCNDYKTRFIERAVGADWAVQHLMKGWSSNEDCGASPYFAHCSLSTVHALLTDSKRNDYWAEACPTEYEKSLQQAFHKVKSGG